MTKESFLEKARKVHGDSYDYSLVPEEFKANDTIEIICKEHGVFKQCARAHYRGSKCPKCARHNRALLLRDRKEQFIEKAERVYGDLYGYELVNYVDSETHVDIICKKHGVFSQTPHHFLKGNGCPKCGHERGGHVRKMSQEEFLSKAKCVHGDKYDYSKSVCKGAFIPLTITCPIHGDFTQKPIKHLSGQGCPECGKERIGLMSRLTKDEFIEKSRSIHGDKYDYTEVEYRGNKELVKIICPKHGMFLQTPQGHLVGHGCPRCTHRISKWEKEVFEFVRSLEIECEQSNRKILEGFEIDIFIPSMSIGIECDGLRWHSELYRESGYHLKKSEECSAKGIRLIHIFEDEWLFKRDIVESMLRNLFGKTETKIYARKCVVKEVLPKEKREFLAKNHIQGDAQSSINIGLYHNDELVAMMTFGKPRINIGGGGTDCEYELVRFCNKLNTSVVGGASKLFKWFTKEYGANSVVSYSDKRWSLGNMYAKLGFTHTHDSAPNYFYIDGLTRLNRFGFRKSVLVKEGYDESKSEHEIMFERGMYRIYDCGTMVWKWLSK